jgi:hypothetical protein
MARYHRLKANVTALPQLRNSADGRGKGAAPLFAICYLLFAIP